MLILGVLLCTCVALVAGFSDNIAEDASLDVPGLIKKYGYTFEKHNVTTSDGYILTMHRIPHGQNANETTARPVVFVMHGLFSSSAAFISLGPGSALGYALADAGYDVWMGNARGNRYSRLHLTLNPDAPLNDDFWKFSWDEIGNIDLPTMLDYALSQTGKSKLHYIGYSQGTTAFFVLTSLQPEYNAKILSSQAMAPVAYVANFENLLVQAIAPLSSSVGVLTSLIGFGELLPYNQVLSWAGQAVCLQQAVTQAVCSNLLFLFSGWNSEYNATMLPVIFSQTPAGSSVRQVVHYGQEVTSKQFRRFDHGSLSNKLIYGSFSPPKYPLSAVTAPVYLYHSTGDKTADVKDVQKLSEELGSLAGITKIENDNFAHLAFAYSENAKALIYDPMISTMLAIDGS